MARTGQAANPSLLQVKLFIAKAGCVAVGGCGLREGHLSLQRCNRCMQCRGVGVRAIMQRGLWSLSGLPPGCARCIVGPVGPVSATDSQGLPSDSHGRTANRANGSWPCPGPLVLSAALPGCGEMAPCSDLVRSVTSWSALCVQAYLITVTRYACPWTTAVWPHQHVVCGAAQCNPFLGPGGVGLPKPPSPLTRISSAFVLLAHCWPCLVRCL
jgi:hypothetical protein